MIGLDQLATILTTGAGGAFTVSVKSNLACRLCHLAAAPGATSQERDELAARRMLLFDPAYSMPDFAQVDIGGEKWNIVQGTAIAPRGPSGAIAFRRVDVTRATP